MIERIHIGVPQIKQLNSEGFFTADMHVHSKYSDTFTKPLSIIKYTAKKGINVAITDHNHIKGSLEAIKYSKKYKTRIIPGIEVSSKQGPHFLTYFYTPKDMIKFYDDHIKNNKRKNPYMALNITVEKIVQGVKDNNGIVSVAHPRSILTWDLQRKINDEAIDKKVIEDIQCAEVLCGLITRKMNLRAINWARLRDFGITGGSDAHTLAKVGSVITYSKENDVHSFLDSLRNKQSYVAGKETKMLARSVSYSKAISKHSRYIGPSVRIHSKLVFRDSYRNLKEKINGNGRR